MGKALVLAFGAIIAATLLLGPKLNVWIRWLTKRLLRIAIERLPEAQRERFSEECASHINEVSGEISKFAVALGYIFAAPEMASLLKSREPNQFYRLSRRFLDSKLSGMLKRTIDIMGSSLALAFFSPVFLIIAIAVKATSDGPIFFRQRRVGQHGNLFWFLKFRSMYVNNDTQVHKQYVQRLIAGKADKHPSNGNGEGVYKLTKDSRITRIGAFLRRTSLDEVPQFLNVLKGEMSLVGPRPPIPYEVEAYEIWHRRRLLEAKPGITGLWQVSGRSRVKFDDMVRLDREYIKILLRALGALLMLLLLGAAVVLILLVSRNRR